VNSVVSLPSFEWFIRDGRRIAFSFPLPSVLKINEGNSTPKKTKASYVF